MHQQARTVGELGESALIERIKDRLGSAPDDEIWSGDDAAVIRSPGERLVYTVDTLVEGVDFDFSYCLGSDVGWKAMAVSVSDIAAMGGRAHYALASLSLPPATLVSVTDGILDGLARAARRWSASVVGGDISAAGELSVSVAMLGAPPRTEPTTRSGARPGEAICVTGSLGAAAGGLIALQRGLAGPGPTEGRGLSSELAAAMARLAERQLRPEPRVEAGGCLAELGVSAMIDVSDGLAVDLGRLADASGVGCQLDPAHIPVDRDLAALVDAVTDEKIDPMQLAITGGEDFELVFTVHPSLLPAAGAGLEQVGTAIIQIGEVTEIGRRIGERDLQDFVESSWDHLLAR